MRRKSWKGKTEKQANKVRLINMPDFLKVAKEAALAGAKETKSRFGKAEIRSKGHNDFVTSADLASEKKIREIILRNFPDHAIAGEEGGLVGSADAECIWYVDPLDGTNNFAFDIPLYGTSVGLARKGNAIAGAVCMPEHESLYWAEKGKGAFLNGKKIQVSKRNKLADSCIMLDSSYHKLSADGKMGQIESLALSSFKLLNLGAAVYNILWVADGRADGVVEFYVHPHDIAAAALILEEAGGVMTKFDGKPWKLVQGPVAGSNWLVHKELLDAANCRKKKQLFI
jgi:myo-inositol-1(or 4)-monophosphatase